jgi:hypothetical protein
MQIPQVPKSSYPLVLQNSIASVVMNTTCRKHIQSSKILVLTGFDLLLGPKSHNRYFHAIWQKEFRYLKVARSVNLGYCDICAKFDADIKTSQTAQVNILKQILTILR